VLWPGKGTNKTCYALKRLGVQDGLITWSGLFGWNATNENYLRFIRWAFDYQRGQERYWLEVRYRHFDEASGRLAPQWLVETGNLEKPSLLEIPGADYELGYNMYRKVNFHQVDVVFDTKANKYDSLTIDDTRFDLSALPGARISEPERPFANGLNFILIAQTRSNEQESDPYVLMDRPRGEIAL
jgi:hypothetical protein